MIYEVNLNVPVKIQKEYNQWLYEHVLEMCTFDGFLEAKTYTTAPVKKMPHYNICVQYHLKDHKSFTEYERTQAKRMRSDGIQKWGSMVQATRRILLTYDLHTSTSNQSQSQPIQL